MSILSTLPNVGSVLESYLLQVGIETPEQLRNIGAEETFMRIRLQVDPGACLHMLYGIQDRFLSDEMKQKLKSFYKTL